MSKRPLGGSGLKKKDLTDLIYHDRLEIITPGGLPAGMKQEDLGYKSVPRNPLLFGLFYRMNLVEQIGSGVQRIRDLCREHGVAEPKFEISENWVTVAFQRETGQVTPQVEKLIGVLQEEMTRGEIMSAMDLRDRMHFFKEYLQPALKSGLVEMTIPDKPRSRMQKYRLTEKGIQLRDTLRRSH